MLAWVYELESCQTFAVLILLFPSNRYYLVSSSSWTSLFCWKDVGPLADALVVLARRAKKQMESAMDALT